MLSKNKVEVEVIFFEELGEYRILKVTDSNGDQYEVDEYIILEIEDYKNEDAIAKSPVFIEYMKEVYGFSETTEFMVVSSEDEDDDSPNTDYIVKIYTIKDSYNFKILKVIPPSSKSPQREEIPVDTDRIFCHLNNDRHNFPTELFDYISEISGSEINTLKIFFSYDVEGCEPAPTGEMAVVVMPALRPTVK